jgi:uncharacterized protein
MFLLLWALLGHVILWVGLLNRAHAVGMNRRLVGWVNVVGVGTLSLTPIAAVALFWFGAPHWSFAWPPADGSRWLLLYLVPCWFVAVTASLAWLLRRVLQGQSRLLRANHSTTIDVAARLGRRPVSGFFGRALDWFPGNQCLTVRLQEKTVEIARLDPALDGLSILHLTDFHFNGRVQPAYFQQVVELACEMRPDLIALTGDFVDDADQIASIPAVLGKLHAPHGVYFVLGNHDFFSGEVPRLRQTLEQAGFIDLGGRWRLLEIRGRTILLAGHELPWIGPAPDLSAAPPAGPDGSRPMRLLLAHTPDAWPWASSHDFDLMLAGHTHGGQICLPWFGPIFCPSRHGVALASGVFRKRPTVLHVSRGLSGEIPLRWNCPPEAAKLILRGPTGPSTR